MKHLLESIKVATCVAVAACTIVACSGTTDTDSETTVSSDSMTMSMDNQGDSMTMGSQPGAMQDRATADLMGIFPDTAVTGSVQFDAEGGKVKMKIDITVPAKSNKNVAVHIHETGDCGDMGKAAGGHWNPTGANHGKWGSTSFHSGDIGNLNLDGNGKGTMELETDLWSLGGDAKTNILNKAVIIHGGVDDYTSQPSGDAGTRIGCGIIK